MLLGRSTFEIELEFNLASVRVIMSGLESMEYSIAFNKVKFFDKLLILQWKREITLPSSLLKILSSFIIVFRLRQCSS